MGFRLHAFVGHHHGAQPLLLLDEGGVFQRRLHGRVELGQHRGRRALGGVQAVPDGQVEILQPHFLQAGVVFEQLVPTQGLGRGHGKGLDPSALDLAGGVGGLITHDVNLAADQRIHGRCRAAKRDRGHGVIELDRVLPHQTADMRSGAQAGVRQVELAGVGANVGLEVAVGIGRQLRLANQGHGHLVNQAEVLEVFQRLVLQLAVQRRCGSHANVKQHQGVAVRRGPGDFGRTDRATGATNVFHHEVGAAAHSLSHGFSQVTRDAVSRTARRKRHHDRDGFRARVALREARQGGYSQGGSQQSLHQSSP